jgi:hypothetical protein
MNFFSSILGGNTNSANIVNGSENSQAVLEIYKSFCDPISLNEVQSQEITSIENRSNKIYQELITLSENDNSKIRQNYESFLKKCNQYFQAKQGDLNSGRDQSIKSNIELGIKIRKEILQKFKEKFSQKYPDSIFDIFSSNIALTKSGNDEDEAIDKRVEEMHKALIGSPPADIEQITRNYQNFLKDSENYFAEKQRLSQGNRAPEDRNKISMGIEIRRKIIDKFQKKFLSLELEFGRDDLTLVSPGSSLFSSLSASSYQTLPTSLNHHPENVLVAPNQAIDRRRVFEEFEAGLNQAILDKAIDSNRPIKDAKNELKEMQKSQNSKDDIFFKNYLLKHLELIKLYEEKEKEMVEKFKKIGDNLDSVYQKFNQLENEARNECLDFLLANVPEEYAGKQYLIKKQLDEMQNFQNYKGDIFFKNYLLKHLELIKLYEEKEMVEKFEKAGDNLDSVYQKFNQLKNEARKECLVFLLANVSNLQQLKLEHKDNLPNRFERKGSQNQDNNFELAEEISKLRSLIPPIFNPLKPQGQTPDEKAIFSFLLKQQRILLSQDSDSSYKKESQPATYRPPNPTPYRPTSPTPYRPTSPTHIERYYPQSPQ